jgi:HEAT repeat protein
MLNPALTEGSVIAATQITTAEMSQREVITTLGRIGPGAQAAVPKLVPFLTNTAVGLRLYSARALWQITGDPKPVVPILRQIIEEEPRYDSTFFFVFDLGLSNSVPLRGRVIQLPRSIEGRHLSLPWSAAYLLGEIGKPAEPALPALRRMLTDIEEFPREEALFTLRAISKITGDNSRFLSLLLKHLNSDSREAQSVRVPVIHFLIELGAAAQPALDRLQVLSTSKEPRVAFAAACAIEWIRGPTFGKEPEVL